MVKTMSDVQQIMTTAGMAKYGIIECNVTRVFAAPHLNLRIEGHPTVKILEYYGEVSPPVIPGDDLIAAVPMFDAFMKTNPYGDVVITDREELREKEMVYMLKLRRNGETIGLYFGKGLRQDAGMTDIRRQTIGELASIVSPEIILGPRDNS